MKKQTNVEKGDGAITTQPITTQPIPSDKSEQMYKISEEFQKMTQKVLGTKPFITVANIMPLAQRELLTESEINSILNVLGQFPYDEVSKVFALVQTHVVQDKK